MCFSVKEIWEHVHTFEKQINNVFEGRNPHWVCVLWEETSAQRWDVGGIGWMMITFFFKFLVVF